ncbi:unnamed protein product [Protopolystoma xenopodis]|uniref:Uncharacterized protein n=1 Tax=Protopolystoma xenopodis TaxID=117903 RepID=A0A3S5CQJ0_9PLAT|nr:unnamed protein product [Protopolystoma xenopodis]
MGPSHEFDEIRRQECVQSWLVSVLGENPMGKVTSFSLDYGQGSTTESPLLRNNRGPHRRPGSSEEVFAELVATFSLLPIESLALLSSGWKLASEGLTLVDSSSCPWLGFAELASVSAKKERKYAISLSSFQTVAHV